MTPVLVLILLFIVTCCLVFVLRVAFRLHHTASPQNGSKEGRREQFSMEWLADFSAERYQPMEGLLDEEDFAFLSQQPGFDFALYKKLRRERLRIFRQYLSRLIADFNRLHAVARQMLAETPGEHSDVLVRLVKLKWNFTAAVFRAEGNYLLCCVGFRTLAVRALIAQLEEMTAQASAIMAMQTRQMMLPS